PVCKKTLKNRLFLQVDLAKLLSEIKSIFILQIVCVCSVPWHFLNWSRVFFHLILQLVRALLVMAWELFMNGHGKKGARIVGKKNIPIFLDLMQIKKRAINVLDNA